MADFFVYKQRFEPALYDFMSHVENGVKSVTNTDSDLFRKLPLLAKPSTDKPITKNPTQINIKEVNTKESNAN